eukprot:CAMPEP_0116017680 /NCGR_PEP_ID=MMETSP0321-20121206/8195_1 /TAXON_ID=163516 /ORGANISM="Leptocylindrus danicus var. danicus, Strain B650" /LENGTH=1719 /DNA_ID=CAMNT_0003487925 /DNA_START=2745 /DNA_END=7904 /DNA_ORIENTATION=-
MLKCIGHAEEILHNTFARLKGQSVKVDLFPSIEETLDAFCSFHDCDSGAESADHAAIIGDTLLGYRTDVNCPLVISGPSGSGKSAVLAKWFTKRKQDGNCNNAEFQFFHVAGASRRSTFVSHVLRRLMRDLREHFDLDISIDDADDERLPWLFPRFLEAASKKGRVLIILDGLHRIGNGSNNDKVAGMKWLPLQFPEGVKIVLTTTTPSLYDVEDFEDEHLVGAIETRELKKKKVLLELQRRKWRIEDMEGMDESQGKLLVDAFCKKFRYRDPTVRTGLILPSEVMDSIFESSMSDLPLFLHLVMCSLGHASFHGYDLWECAYRWLHDAENFNGLYEAICEAFERGHKATPEKSARAIAKCEANECADQMEASRPKSQRRGTVHRQLLTGSTSENRKAISLNLERLSGLKRGDSELGAEDDGSDDCDDESDNSSNDGYSSFESGSNDDNGEENAPKNVKNIGQQRGHGEHLPVYLKGGVDVTGLGNFLGDAFSLLYVSRHGLRIHELVDILVRMKRANQWQKKMANTTLPTEIKIFNKIVKQRNRLIDIFRSFDVDKNGQLSREEFVNGIVKLGVDASRQEIDRLIDAIDVNSDGEITYEEAIQHFDHNIRQSFHTNNGISVPRSKDMLNNFGQWKEVEDNINNKVHIDANTAALLISALICLGVVFVGDQNILVLALESDMLRDAIWNRYIVTKEKEQELHSFLASYFLDLEPNMRRCEELPWHLYECHKWVALKNTLVDLRTFDLMYNQDDILKGELFTWLLMLAEGQALIDGTSDRSYRKNDKRRGSHILPGDVKCSSSAQMPPFDVVDEFNRAVELWYQGVRPPQDTLANMILNIAKFMGWFSAKMMHYVDAPAFMRKPIDFGQLREAGFFAKIDFPWSTDDESLVKWDNNHQSKQKHPTMKELMNSGAGDSAISYYVERWLWIQWPWLALKDAAAISMQIAKGRKLYRQGMSTGNANRKSNEASQMIGSEVMKTKSSQGDKASDREVNSLNTTDSVRRYWLTKVQSDAPTAARPVSARDKARSSARNECAYVKVGEALVDADREECNENADPSVKEVTLCSSKEAAAFGRCSVRSANAGSRFPSAEMHHADKIKREEENLDHIGKDAADRFGGQTIPTKLGDKSECNVDKCDISTFPCTPDELHRKQESKKLGRMRIVYDKLVVESKKKEKELREIKQEISDQEKSVQKFDKAMTNGEEVIGTMHRRLDLMNSVVRDAAKLGSMYTCIEQQLIESGPANDRKYLSSLEQQLRLTRQQYADLLKKKREIQAETERLRRKEKHQLEENVRKLNKKRATLASKLRDLEQACKPLQQPKQASIMKAIFLENVLNKCTAGRSPSISKCTSVPSMFSNFKSSKQRTPTFFVKSNSLTKSSSDPAMLSDRSIESAAKNGNDVGDQSIDEADKLQSLFDLAGTVDPDQISEVLKEARRQEQKLQLQKNVQDQTIELLKKDLEALLKEREEHRLMVGNDEDDNCNDGHDGNEVSTALQLKCSQKRKIIEVKQALAQQVKAGIIHIAQLTADSPSHAARESAVRRGSTVQNIGVSQYMKSLYQIEKRLSRMMELIDEEKVNELDSSADYVSVGTDGSPMPVSPTNQIRITRRTENENEMNAQLDQIIAARDIVMEREERGSLEADDDTNHEKVELFINEALKTSESINQQRLANILTNSKQNKRANRGLVIENILESDGNRGGQNYSGGPSKLKKKRSHRRQSM